MSAITWSVMTARNTGAATYAATDRQPAELAAARFMPAEAPAQITMQEPDAPGRLTRPGEPDAQRGQDDHARVQHRRLDQ